MRSRHAASLAALAALALVVPATAHDTPPTREVLAQASPDGLQIMIVHREAKSERVELMRQRFDIDGDGHFNDAESAIAQKVWAKHVVAGLRFEVPGERPRIEPPRLKLGIDEEGGLNAAFLMVFTLEDLAEGAERKLRVSLDEGNHSPTAVTFQAVDGLGVRAPTGALEPGTATVTLAPGGHASAAFALRSKAE